jgi:lipoprotein-anchoring transpeptidase ErfK/SrfK
MKRLIAGLGLFALVFSLLGAYSRLPVAAAAGTGRSQHLPWVGIVAFPSDPQTTLVSVRSAPRLRAPIVTHSAIGAPVTVYAVVKGDAVSNGNRLWYRISPAKAPARYIYSQYVVDRDQLIPAHGKMILISLSGQWLFAFQDGRRLLDTPVTTGRPELPTPTGTYHVLAKYSPYEFISPWPVGSPYYYPPSMTNYALEFRADGYFIHDAPWRNVYGPGTNLPHNDPGDPFGSHGCVNVPFPAQKKLFAWAAVGTEVKIIA